MLHGYCIIVFIMASIHGISANLNALLDTIAWSEIGPALLSVTDNGYNCLVGSSASDPLTFSSYSDHPRIYNPKFNSTAAGRYQIIKGMYDAYKIRCGLNDFSPISQDTIAVQMIRERGALPDIEDGNLFNAVSLICPIWASLPGNAAGQHQNSTTSLMTAFIAAGGASA